MSVYTIYIIYYTYMYVYIIYIYAKARGPVAVAGLFLREVGLELLPGPRIHGLPGPPEGKVPCVDWWEGK